MAIHRRHEPTSRFSYTGSLPCLSYSRSMITVVLLTLTSIIATNQTLCYLLALIQRQRSRNDLSRYCSAAVLMGHSDLYGKSRFALLLTESR
jgi:hypothetical protein